MVDSIMIYGNEEYQDFLYGENSIKKAKKRIRLSQIFVEGIPGYNLRESLLRNPVEDLKKYIYKKMFCQIKF